MTTKPLLMLPPPLLLPLLKLRKRPKKIRVVMVKLK
jgi:hypothetical protein